MPAAIAPDYLAGVLLVAFPYRASSVHIHHATDSVPATSLPSNTAFCIIAT
jgi:hypothetical protein